MASAKLSFANVVEWLKPTLEKEGLKDYKIEVSGGNEKGDGYMGDITFVEVSGKTITNEEKTYNFVIKTGKRSKDLRELMPIRQAFENEIFFYNEILPTFVKFQEEKGVEVPFKNTPKCYGTVLLDEVEVLILGNMKQRGYSLHNRYNPMDKQHIREVIKTYGKWHAISFALRDQKPEIFKNLAENLHDIFKIINETLKPSEGSNHYEIIIQEAKKENDDRVVENAFILNQKVLDSSNLAASRDNFTVILHGDCWNNNFLFKYENDQITDLCLLDFQLTRLASPVCDLSYFLFTCISEEDIVNFDEINGLYYQSFSKFLRELGGDPESMFPYEELMNQWKKYAIFGLTMLPSIIRICVTDKDDAIELEDVSESVATLEEAFSSSIKEIDQYRKRTLPIMRLAIDKGFI